ncbi:MAG: lysophospholipid acyltransferase family protein [Marmoricola sp.]
MNDALPIDGGELPSTSGVRPPHTRLLTAGRPLAQALIRRWYEVEILGAERVPATGPVVMAANHVGWIDGPLLAICSPRPVHALTKREMFSHGLGGFLIASGQIPLDRFHVDVSAIRLAVKALESGLAVGVFPEGTRGAGDMTSPRAGAAYLALLTGAPVVPVSFLGTRMPGGADGSIPPRGSRIAMTFGEPVPLGTRPWPRTQREVAEAAQIVTAAILKTIREAQERTGMTLPGPLGPKREKKKA